MQRTTATRKTFKCAVCGKAIKCRAVAIFWFEGDRYVKPNNPLCADHDVSYYKDGDTNASQSR